MNGPVRLPPGMPLSEADRMLWEWYQEWWRRDDMPAKLGNALHIRTAMHFIRLVNEHKRANP